MDQFDREEEAIDRAYERGEITAKEHSKKLHELRRDYQQAAREAAQREYDREIDRW